MDSSVSAASTKGQSLVEEEKQPVSTLKLTAKIL